MADNIHCVNIWFKFFFILIHITIIVFSSIFYSIEKFHSDIFIPTNCQINKTFTLEIPCQIRQQTTRSSQINQLCNKTYYGIIYADNMFTYIDQLPHWFSPIDEENLRQTPMMFSGKILSKPMNIRCYYDQLTHTHIRWTQPDPKGFIQLILFSFIALSLTVIHCFDGYCCRKRSQI